MFFKREFPALARSLAFVMGDADLGADTAQESFLRVFARWDRYASPEHARRSAIRIGMNLARTRWRREHRIEALADRAEESPGPDVEDRLVLGAAVSGLSPRQRSCVVLVDYLGFDLGFDVAEAARMLRMIPSTVRVHLDRGRRRLAVTLQSSYLEDRE